MRYLILTLLLIPILFLSNGYTQDWTTWGLPDGAKRRIGKGKITTIEFSPAGSQIAVASSVGIWLYDARTGKELALLPGHREGFSTSVFSGVGGTLAVNTLAFSPEGKMLVSASELGTIWLWDLKTGHLLTTLMEHEAAVDELFVGLDNKIGLAFSPNGTLLASGGEDGAIMLSEVSTKPNSFILKGHHTWRVKALVFSPDGRYFVSGSRDNSIRVWDVETGMEYATLNGHVGEVNALAFSDDGTTLISGSIDDTILLWDWKRLFSQQIDKMWRSVVLKT